MQVSVVTNDNLNLEDLITAALLVRGARPKAEAGEEETILRFDSCKLYFVVDGISVSLNERMEHGGNVLIADWTFDGHDLPRFAARVVHESWTQFVAECGCR